MSVGKGGRREAESGRLFVTSVAISRVIVDV